MVTLQDFYNEPIASLEIRHSQSATRSVLRPVHAGEQFDVGRKDIQQIFAVCEATLSSHHLRFHCIVFETFEAYGNCIPPLVYVAVLSNNPATICEFACSPGIRQQKKSDPAYLLNDGDVMYLNDRVSITYRSKVRGTAALSDTLRAERKRFSNQYLLMSRMLGAGAYGSVFLALNTTSRRQVACKVVRNSFVQRVDPTRSQKSDHLTRLQREYTILQMLDHPNIIRLEKVIRTTNHIYFFEELVLGGDLMSLVQSRGNLTETNALPIVRQVLKAVEYLHDNGVAHRDIKPENILLTSWRDGARVVLTDFGGAIMSPAKASTSLRMFRMQTVIGTPGYQAPEMFNRSPEAAGYTPAADIWSVGCLTVSICTGNTPYEQTEYDDLATQFNSDKMQRMHAGMLQNICNRETISEAAMDFIRKCLLLDADVRPSARAALDHIWFMDPNYAVDIEDAYVRAIGDWTPRGHSNNLAELIDTSDLTDMSQKNAADFLPQESSKHFDRSREAGCDSPSDLRASPVQASGPANPHYSPEL